jgi:DNA-binding NarL/FixJ family response regulator
MQYELKDNIADGETPAASSHSPSTAQPADAPSQRPCVIVADDHALVRDGIRLLVGHMLHGAEIVDAHDGDSLLRAAAQHAGAKLALVDLNMPGMEKGYRLAELARQRPQLPLVVISALTSPEVVRRTMAIPTVHAFIPKSAPQAHTCAAIEAALQGLKLPYVQSIFSPGRPDVTLTPRMEEIRRLVQQGMSNKQIANTLGISEGTVKNHMSEIFKALQVSNRTQAAQLDTDRL